MLDETKFQYLSTKLAYVQGVSRKQIIMTKKKNLKQLFCAVFLVVVTSFAVMASGEGMGPEMMTLNGGRFGDVLFTHGIHQKMFSDCNVCHQLFPKKTGIIVELKSEGKLQGRQVMKECTACHFEKKKKGEKTGPTSCGGCHK